jgi:NNP family nitrate/nitrite transporter-like MFS transporter
MTMRPATRPDGHLPTLFACFLHFDVCFMLWVLIGALGGFIFDGPRVDAALKGLLVGVPVLTGSLLRLPLGWLSDRVGGKAVGVGLLVFLTAPLLLGWFSNGTVGSLLATGLLLGCAGASFAIVLPLASRWYPPERQGLVMGIAAAGNSGTVLANLFAPRLAAVFGWQNVFGLALLPLGIVFVLFAALAREAPRRAAAPGSLAAVYRQVAANPDLWWLCAFYAITFGGYVGLSSFLPVFLRDQFEMSPASAGLLTAGGALAGSLARPVGGYLADRLGGVRLLQILLIAIAAAYPLFGAVSTLEAAAPLLVATMVCLGLGNGVVFQLVPQRFPLTIGLVTGLVGAVGGVGGFLLPTLLGAVKQGTGSFAVGLTVLGGVAAAAALALATLRRAEDETQGAFWRAAPLAAPEA